MRQTDDCTLKHESLGRVPVIRGFGHLARLLGAFEVYHNDCRRHMTLGGALAAVIHRGGEWSKRERPAKTLLAKVEQLVFGDSSVTAYRLVA